MSIPSDQKSTKADPRPCAATVRSGWHDTGCQKNASIERDGVWYCGIHDPVKREHRNSQREAEEKKWSDISLAAKVEGAVLARQLGVSPDVYFERNCRSIEIGYRRRLIIDFDDLKRLFARAESR